jgi:dolichol-phosphate mannosyltransferase
MSDEATQATRVIPGLHIRVRHGMRHPHNWFQLGRFVAVGASGYVVNLAVFTVCVHGLGVNYLVAATLAFLVAVTNNFVWNRHWTFDARGVHAGFQAFRFFVVSVAAFLFNIAILYALVEGAGLGKVPAQAIAIVLATPVSFVGNKLWSFRT